MRESISIILIILSIALTALVLVQNKGDNSASLLGASGDQVQRTRRGMEAILHSATVLLSAIFFVFVVICVFFWGA